jgi:hypothetical protein
MKEKKENNGDRKKIKQFLRTCGKAFSPFPSRCSK